MPNEKMTRAPEQADEIAYLKIILDSLVENQSLFGSERGNLGKEFLEELKHSVELALRRDAKIGEDARAKILQAFDMLTDNYDEHF